MSKIAGVLLAVVMITSVASIAPSDTSKPPVMKHIGGKIKLKAHNIDIVTSTGRCSCSLATDYKKHTNSFLNKCPYCHRKGTLAYEKSAKTNCQEGMWYCTRCDTDFCLVHGKTHTTHNSLYLTRV